MKALEEHGFPVPSAIDCNRHCVIMSLVQGYPFVQVRQLQNPYTIFEIVFGLVVRQAKHGLIHCDFNEFNIMIDDDEKVTMIDFPQMVSVSHRNAQMYFDCDVECIYKFFRKRHNLTLDEHPSEASGSGDDKVGRPCFSSISKSSGCLDQELAASGFSKANQIEIEKFIEGQPEDVCSGGVDDGDDDQSSANEEGTADSIKEMNKEKLDSLHLVEQQGKKIDMLDGQQVSAPGHSSELETQDASDEEEENSKEDPELMKRLSKQRRRAIAAPRGRRTNSSRNSYKDKGGESSCTSKVQKQSCGW